MKTKLTLILATLAFSVVLIARLLFPAPGSEEQDDSETPLAMESSRGTTVPETNGTRLLAATTKRTASSARMSLEPDAASTNTAAAEAAPPDPNDRRARGLALMKRRWAEVQAREMDYRNRAASLWEGMPLSQVIECMGQPRAADSSTQKPAWTSSKGEFPQEEFKGKQFELIYSTHEANFQRQVVTEPGFRAVRVFMNEQGVMIRYDWEIPGDAGYN